MTLFAGLQRLFTLLVGVRGRRPAPTPEPRAHPWEKSYPPGIDWRFEATPRPVFSILDAAVASYPDRPCLEFLGKGYSYREVGDLVARACKGFQDLGVAKGVRVGLFLPNTPYFVICYHAVLKAGGTVVNYNPLYAEREVARQIVDSDTEILVTINLKTLFAKIAGRLDDSCLKTVVVCTMSGILPFPDKALFAIFRRKEIAAVPADEAFVKFDRLIANKGDFAPANIDPRRDVAVLQYTGGTTGTPKGAMLSHANLYANCLQTRAYAAEARPGAETVLAVLPLFHVFGMTVVMNVSLLTGARMVLLPRFKVRDLLAAIDKHRVTILFGVPTMYSAINGHAERDKHDLSSLRFAVSGGAPLPLQVKQDFEAASGCVLVEGYGLTEAAPVCTINPISGLNKPGSAGLPIPGTVIEVVSLDDPEHRLALGEAGEVCISGPQVMAGYWGNQEESTEVLRDGWLRTGDVGYLDDDGYLFLIDRIKDLIITGGYNVYPRMVEEAIYLHPDVAEAAVCGVADKHHGEIVKAFVVLRPGAELGAAGLREFLKDKLAYFERPRRVEFLLEIPKTLVGKPLRRALVAGEAAEPELAVEETAV